ncbi:hypothetical protein OJF2_45850 [Aquisphaera giovannonii]|uniref:PEP-CTERM protein-sorting domain-containing protein n=1 Tax=Aquisphaera giovannonii TaxID=406548 RepID=A0A5B9W6S0_9BACT|nr:hypothetical protein [Aquisphaera giovannonii]QEH36027.1 hypothetical protein OJF2_45850 [Aquisphaera giovannonii]
MRCRFALAFPLAMLGTLSADAGAAVIPVSIYQGTISTGPYTSDVGGLGSVSLPPWLPTTLVESPQGGGSIDLPITSSLFSPGKAYPDQTYPIVGQFRLTLRLLTPGTTDQFGGPEVVLAGIMSGSLDGPKGGDLAGGWSGGYGGTATFVTFNAVPGLSQDTSQLPAVLQDALKHPDHVHVSVLVTGGFPNYLQASVTFDPTSANEVPEPSVLLTLVAGLGLLIPRPRRAGARPTARSQAAYDPSGLVEEALQPGDNPDEKGAFDVHWLGAQEARQRDEETPRRGPSHRRGHVTMTDLIPSLLESGRTAISTR